MKVASFGKILANAMATGYFVSYKLYLQRLHDHVFIPQYYYNVHLGCISRRYSTLCYTHGKRVADPSCKSIHVYEYKRWHYYVYLYLYSHILCIYIGHHTAYCCPFHCLVEGQQKGTTQECGCVLDILFNINFLHMHIMYRLNRLWKKASKR